MVKRKRVLIDFDDVICDGVLLNKINEFLKTNYKISDFKDYVIDSIVPDNKKQQFYTWVCNEDFYKDAKLIPNSKRVIKRLCEKYDVYICSSCIMLCSPLTSGPLFASKYNFLLKNFPFIDPKRFVFTSSKDIVSGDIFIDDYFHNLRSKIKTKFLFTSYHNQNFTDEELKKRGVVRVKDWLDIEQKLL